MTGNLRHINKVMEQNQTKTEVRAEKQNSLPLVHKSCNYSSFTFAMWVSGALVFAGIMLYALLV